MALAVTIIEPIQVGAVPLAALALVAAVLMPALPHLPLEGASGRLLALEDLDGGALMVALLFPLLPSSSASILTRSRSSSSIVAFSICVVVSTSLPRSCPVFYMFEHTAHRTNPG
jgi:hypothetical protein